MSLPNQKQSLHSNHGATAQSPVTLLAEALAPEMQRVNATILEYSNSPVPLIPQLAGYLIAAGGKRIRPLLTLACASVFGADMGRAALLAATVEFIHTATLLHDDVVDESEKRRDQDTANQVFGNQASVLVGDFLFSRAFQLMVRDGSLDVLRILSDASAIIAQGEVMQLTTTGNLATGWNDYLEVIKAKTAALFAAACEVGPVVAGASPSAAAAMAEYGMNLGIAFQIADDALDYAADREKLGKMIGDDFREGKMTAPVLIAIEGADGSEKDFWVRTMVSRQQESGDLLKAQDILSRHDAVERCLLKAGEYAQKAQLALAEAPDHALRSFLHDLADYAVRRES